MSDWIAIAGVLVASIGVYLQYRSDSANNSKATDDSQDG